MAPTRGEIEAWIRERRQEFSPAWRHGRVPPAGAYFPNQPNYFGSDANHVTAYGAHGGAARFALVEPRGVPGVSLMRDSISEAYCVCVQGYICFVSFDEPAAREAYGIQLGEELARVAMLRTRAAQPEASDDGYLLSRGFRFMTVSARAAGHLLASGVIRPAEPVDPTCVPHAFELLPDKKWGDVDALVAQMDVREA